ncbi:two-component system, OmpR family, osmolarity sensor histidine kinase EnvZ [Rhizobium sp. RU35A]|nr:two-component system, OmpR family, osmolarity sensor histidine kinase EnvZ [Rhizobium sp. RU35A]
MKGVAETARRQAGTLLSRLRQGLAVMRCQSVRLQPPGWAAFGRWLKRRMPTGLYMRSVLIVIIPMLLLQSVVAAVFMERHWRLVTERLSQAVTRDIAAIIELIRTYPDPSDDYSAITRIARNQLSLNISIEPDAQLPPPRSKPFFSILDDILADQINQQIRLPYWIDTVGDSRLVEIRIQLDNKVLRVFTLRNQTYASNTHIFLVWMVGTSLLLIGISVLFLRGQIRPILALADAAESFGKGQKMPAPFSPRGADEIRRAGIAFIQMRERIERQIEQRTAMLTGISHDLRTILTRFKLQLALAGDNPDLAGMGTDVDDMQSMLEGYLAFARSEAAEDFGEMRLSELLEKMTADFALHGKTMTYRIDGEDKIAVRPGAFQRLVGNLASNSRRYANSLHVEARHNAKWLTLTFDDDGPGIPEASREDVFKPFYRLDEARNLDASGTGLGLAIARDIARAHGGNVTLGDSPMGGLRATVRVPA